MKNVFNNEIINSFYSIYMQERKILQSDAERVGLTVVQLRALYKISVRPNVRLAELAERMKSTNSTISSVIDRLVDKELVERKTSENDRRAITICLTLKGEEKLREFQESKSETVQKLQRINDLPAEDIKRLLEIHQKILSILKD
ncbi:MarR family transcriptional regulator [Rummeliibacillus stabekisii]|uniref:HTH marR-type domain-containing protein n=1 Tax=Rummeliibacillus stabekisii TaxID=241244 RepID=A0A143HEX9_9BACL|nr:MULTISPECIES: MarR family transcriptional regulator [Rummeliibacillus]AMX00284.1 hypothetical protein ATY39_13215 [Rummeliibacillus stabekisii]MCM3317870.1 MarR family transcriptional regulator [Rummeliibacillus stabekisii]